MLIYIMHSDKIFTFRLPKEISGSYMLTDYDFGGNKRSLVNISSNNGKWYVSSNIDVKVKYNSKIVDSIELVLYNFYQLTVFGTENVIIYICPAYENSYMVKGVVNNSTLLIGSGNGCDITYNYAGVDKKQLELKYENGVYKFNSLNKKIPVFINKKRRDSGILENLDTIFLMGLKIVVCGNFLLINNPAKLVYLMSSKFCENKSELIIGDYSIENAVYKNFYDEKDYYNRAPLFLKKIHPLELEIALPPNKTKNDNDSFLSTIIPSILMFSTSAYTGLQAFVNIQKDPTTMKDNLASIIMCVTMFISSIVWPFIERILRNVNTVRKNLVRRRKFKKYLKKKETILKNAIAEQKMALCSRYVSLNDCQDIIFNRTSGLFSRTIENDDFLVVRLGNGAVPLDCNIMFDKPEYSEDNDNLIEDADRLIKENKYIPDVPYTVSLREKNIVGFVGNIECMPNYIKSIMLQILTFQNYNDLKIVVLTDEAESSMIGFLNESNHCWTNDKSYRYFASNANEGEEISTLLEKEFQRRKASKNEKFIAPFYLIVTDNISMYKNLKIIKDLDSSSGDIGFGLLIFSQKVSDLPSNCTNFVDYNEKEGVYFESEMSDTLSKFKPEFIDNVNFNECIRKIYNIPIKIEDMVSGNLPDTLGFLELYGIGKVEQFNSLERWKSPDVINSLAAPIGVDPNGNILNLDLHEKKHGPHGLVAGMTGSGKSEFIVTYILSLSVNYSPEEVQFVLIDYKGGGLAGAFENRKTGIKLPHLVGTITNLDKSEMKRTLVSIKSELQRRQRAFNLAKEQLNTGTIDIYKYQRLVREGSLKNPMSHLFIICDEFAELKAQQPEFMDELVSAARIGRSLGVHLILATQKPSGVVDDQIWSNSKFKVCCKVQTVDDSREMIRRDDAAYLKQSGRFYLQVGYDEYFVLGQSAYSGIMYVPSERSITKIDNTLDFLNDTGEIIKNVKKETKKQESQVDFGEELGNILKYLINEAKSINFVNKQLWLDNVAPIIYIEDVKKKYETKVEPYNINPVVGEYDDPKTQSQGIVTIPFNTKGNTFIVGVSGSGKTTLLNTIIYSTIVSHNVDEVNFYLVDLLAETLKQFNKAPQVGDFVGNSTPDKLSKLFYFLRYENEKRKKYYSNKIKGFEAEVKAGKASFPNIMVIINGMDVFKEQYETIYEDIFVQLSRESNRNGIYFIVTGTSISSLGFLAENNFSNKIMMRQNDPTEYKNIFPSCDIVPAMNPGRGLIEMDDIYEFQTSLIFNDSILESNLNYVFEQLNKFLKNRAKKIPVMPKLVTKNLLEQEISDLTAVPVGIEFNGACPYTYDFSNFINIILCKSSSLLKMFIPQVSQMLIESIDYKLVILDAYSIIESIDNDNIRIYNSNFKKLISSFVKNIEIGIKNKTNKKLLFIINGYTTLEKHLNELKAENDDVKNITELIMTAKDSSNYKFIIVDECRMLRDLDNDWGAYADNTSGILLGMSADDQSTIIVKPRYDLDGKIMSDTAIVVKDSEQELIKYVRR